MSETKTFADTLVIIPARGGSKRLPGKNIRDFCGQPLINYSVNIARSLFPDNQVCVSTDSQQIIDVVETTGFKVAFTRPAHLAEDTTTTRDVLLHAIDFYEKKGLSFKRILLLQPTSPLRTEENIKQAFDLYNDALDMVVSVTEIKNVITENEAGHIQNLVQQNKGEKTYQYNGAVYIINISSLKAGGIAEFKKVKLLVMPKEESIDIDDAYDWACAEAIQRLKK